MLVSKRRGKSREQKTNLKNASETKHSVIRPLELNHRTHVWSQLMPEHYFIHIV